MTYEAISWHNVARAISFYADQGFQYVEVPWIVRPEAVAATLPAGKQGYSTQIGALVGSAEQSFIELLMQGNDLNGLFMAATPCFRDDVEDELHQHYFFKVELFAKHKSWYDAKVASLDMVHIALEFFLMMGVSPSFVKTDVGYDAVLNGVEIGSYGPREFRGHFWTYGTGLAEPRFSQARAR